MIVKYMIHRIGTPKFAFPNHPSYWESEYWGIKDGWGHKSTGDVFTKDLKEHFNLPIDGEWVEIYVNEPVEE
jgi:hypothetical protein